MTQNSGSINKREIKSILLHTCKNYWSKRVVSNKECKHKIAYQPVYPNQSLIFKSAY